MKKRSLTIAGHRTSITLEEAFWTELKAIAAGRGQTVTDLVTDIDATRDLKTNLSSALRLFVLQEIKK
jgi:predicted DNA-binding ribbon-helix-helix protein